MVPFPMLRRLHGLSPQAVGMFAGLLVSTGVRAAAGCPVRVEPFPADSAWSSAGRDLERQLRTTHDGQRCGSIQLLVENDAARLTLETRDGRRAVRELSEPFELQPTVLALLVTLESPPKEEPTPPETARAPEYSIDVPQPRTDSAAEASRAAGVFGAAVGARAGGGFATPVIGGYGLVRAGRWEVGAGAQWETSYRRTNEDDSEWHGEGLSAGLLVSRRHPISTSLDVLLGATVAGAVLRQGHRGGREGQGRFDGRLGGYLGAVWPTRSLFRMRTLVGADFVAIGDSQSTTTPNAPSLPGWAATVSLGVESWVPF